MDKKVAFENAYDCEFLTARLFDRRRSFRKCVATEVPASRRRRDAANERTATSNVYSPVVP